MKVYTLHTGCRFEGGGTESIYATAEDAVKAALKLLKLERKKELRIMGKDSWEEIINKYGDHIIKIWQSDVDEIIVQKYTLK